MVYICQKYTRALYSLHSLLFSPPAVFSEMSTLRDETLGSSPSTESTRANDSLVARSISAPVRGVHILAPDISGSTDRSAIYWNQMAEIYQDALRRAREDNSTLQILSWNTEVFEESCAQFDTRIERRGGNGGTDPSSLATHIVNFREPIRHLTLISDGQIAHADVQRCDRIFDEAAAGGTGDRERILGADVSCYLINTGVPVNMSVVTPFVRNVPHCITIVDPAPGSSTYAPQGMIPPPPVVRVVAELTADDVTVATNVITGAAGAPNTFAEFERARVAITNIVASASRGRDPNHEKLKAIRAALLKMQRNIVSTEALISGEHPDIVELDRLIAERNFDIAAAGLHNAYRAVYGGVAADAKGLPGAVFAANFSHILSLTNGVLQCDYRHDAVNAASYAFSFPVSHHIAAADATPTEPPQPDNDEAVRRQTNVTPYECPIIGTTGSAVVIFVKKHDQTRATDGSPSGAGDAHHRRSYPVLVGKDPNLTKVAINSPLSMCGMPAGRELLAEAVSKLGHGISLEALRHARDAGFEFTKDPLTREPVAEYALVLGCSTEAVNATNSAIRYIFTGTDRNGGSPDLVFLAIVWAIMCPTSGIAPPYESFAAEYGQHLVAHLKYRIANHSAPIGLSGLATNRARAQVKIATALYFIANSTAIAARNKSEPPIAAHLLAIRVFDWVCGPAVLDYPPPSPDVTDQQMFIRALQLVEAAVKGGVDRPLHPDDGPVLCLANQPARINRIAAAARALNPKTRTIYVPNLADTVSSLNLHSSSSHLVDFIPIADAVIPKSKGDPDYHWFISQGSNAENAQAWFYAVLRITPKQFDELTADIIAAAALTIQKDRTLGHYFDFGHVHDIILSIREEYARIRQSQNLSWSCLNVGYKCQTPVVEVRKDTGRPPLLPECPGGWMASAIEFASLCACEHDHHRHDTEDGGGGGSAASSPQRCVPTPITAPGISNTLQMSHFYMEAAIAARRWPTVEQVAVYIFNKVAAAYASGYRSLPRAVVICPSLPFAFNLLFIRQVEAYRHVMDELGFEEAAIRYTKSRRSVDRARIEAATDRETAAKAASSSVSS